jgi:hypothetical protein
MPDESEFDDLLEDEPVLIDEEQAAKMRTHYAKPSPFQIYSVTVDFEARSPVEAQAIRNMIETELNTQTSGFWRTVARALHRPFEARVSEISEEAPGT